MVTNTEEKGMENLLNEIECLRAMPHGTWQLKREMSNTIKDLKRQALDFAGAVLAMSNKIKNLEADLASVENYSDKQADVIRHYINQIARLENECR